MKTADLARPYSVVMAEQNALQQMQTQQSQQQVAQPGFLKQTGVMMGIAAVAIGAIGLHELSKSIARQ